MIIRGPRPEGHFTILRNVVLYYEMNGYLLGLGVFWLAYSRAQMIGELQVRH